MSKQYDDLIKPMFEELYYKLLSDVNSKNDNSMIYKHHINPIAEALSNYHNVDYLAQEPNQIVVDYIASMTDDYFISLYKHLFPNSKYKIEYEPYF
jgi:dGTPase